MGSTKFLGAIILSVNLLFCFGISKDVHSLKLPVSTDSNYWFCHGIACPDFKNVTGKGNFELREYPKSQWVSTEVQIKSYDEFTSAQNTAFMRLFHYISGENEANSKIDMTAPVLTKITPGQGPFCASTLQISFFVPPELAGKAPKPTNDKVVFTEFRGTVWVKNFKTPPPEPDGKKVTEEAKAFGDKLIESNNKFLSEPYYFAAYDPPFRLFGRHDEIW
eukprot:CAMPEP_0204826466 /NCGR_PEP_ID=MMETSP1346-20131115/4153_1 /ASSEMBLY_ACC=CAM_ASM_000771 /TAXON_ID=215587 /ORGANISM="Aplanochytrium stocchinoi, Strain GSBS06" /LENGTH=219 /DNA_ID=CAMNT_0051954507 /DNA_START=141 /DNA_END=797 /DNA_ORIENTATION=-